MARTLGKTVTVCDSVIDGVPQGRVHTILLGDDEEVPFTPDRVEEFLAKEAEFYDVVGEKTLEAALTINEPDDQDAVKRVLATLDALDADVSAEAEAWKSARMG